MPQPPPAAAEPAWPCRPPLGRRLARGAGQLATALGDLVFEPGCLLCRLPARRRRGNVCLRCWSGLRPATRTARACLLCGEPPVPGETSCRHCRDHPPPWSWLVTALDYSGQGRALILLYKFGPQGGRIPLARPLASCLAAAMRASGIGRDIDCLTAVPSHRARIRERGFDAAWLLARALARSSHLPAPRSFLKRIDATGPRARPPGERPGASRRPFRLRRRAARRLAGRRVLLVDDVLTTGATLRSCAGLLAASGAAEVRTLALARTRRHSFDPAGGIV